jgi:hypothetical protein
MAPRPTSDLATLFASLVDELRVELAASVERSLTDFSRRLTRLEKRLDELDSPHATAAAATPSRVCTLCEKPVMARGLCSAHYQQWRYRERKQRLTSARSAGLRLPGKADLSGDN